MIIVFFAVFTDLCELWTDCFDCVVYMQNFLKILRKTFLFLVQMLCKCTQKNENTVTTWGAVTLTKLRQNFVGSKCCQSVSSVADEAQLTQKSLSNEAYFCWSCREFTWKSALAQNTQSLQFLLKWLDFGHKMYIIYNCKLPHLCSVLLIWGPPQN